MAHRDHPSVPDTAATPAAAPWGRGDWIFSALLAAAVFLAYQSAWQAGFIWGDDTRLTAAALPWHPVLHAAFWLEARIFGDHATGYHLVGIAVHALNTVLLLRLLRELRVPGAPLAAGLFALHPVMVQSVVWIAEFKGPLSGAFYLGAALAYLRFDASRRGPTYAAALGLFVLALLTKTSTATLPAALAVVLWWRRGGLSWPRDVRPLLPFFALGAVDGLGLAWIGSHGAGAQGADFAFSGIERGLIAGRAAWFYLVKIIYPAELSFMYPRWIITQDEWWQFLFPVALLIGLVNLWLGRKARGRVAAALFFLVTLLPSLGFISLSLFAYTFVADHVAYLAGIGVFVPVAAGIGGLKRWLGPAAPAALGLVLLVSFGLLTWSQGRTYREAESLYRLTLVQNPEGWMAQESLGVLLVQAGRTEEGVRQLAQEGELHPQTPNGKYHLAMGLKRLGRVWEAIPLFEELVRAQPDDAERLANLGEALLLGRQPRDALACFQEALRLDPKLARAQAGKEKAEREILKL